MRINKYWTLGSDYYPVPSWDGRGLSKSSKEQYDSVTIIHFGRCFRPIILCEDRVRSGVCWKVEVFWHDLLNAIKASKKKCNVFFTDRGSSFLIERAYYTSHNHVRWGCRTFTTKQLETIRDTMKWHYTKDELKGGWL